MSKIEKIRAKIDRMLDDICEADGFVQKKDEPRYDALTEVLDFIDTLEEESDKSLVEEVKRYYSDNFAYISSDQPTLSILTNVARHFAEWADRHKGIEGSEEDKRKLNRIYEILGYAADDKGFLTSKRIIGDKEAIELQDFLKSLSPSWKPSEEQMKALEECGECKRCIKELYEQLSKRIRHD